MIKLKKQGPVASSKREAQILATLSEAYGINLIVSRMGWPGYVPEVTRILAGAGLDVSSTASIEDVERELTKLKGYNGSGYIFLETFEKFPKEIDDNIGSLLEEGWKLHRFALEDIAEAATHNQLVLAYEPGLGKTRASLAWATLKGATRTLVVAPRRLHGQWRREIESVPFNVDFKLVSYDDLWRYEERHPDCDVAILDEVHNIKNTETLRFKAAMNLAATKRIGLTGTLIGGHVKDLHGIVAWTTAKRPYTNTIGPDFRERYGERDKHRERPGIRLGSRLREKLAHLIKVRTRAEPEVEFANQTPLMLTKRLEMEPDLLHFYLMNARRVRDWWLSEEAQTEARARLGLHRLLRAANMPQSLSGWGNKETDLQRYILSLADTGGSGTILMASHLDVANFYASRLGATPVTSRIPMERRQRIIDSFKEQGGFLVGTIGVLGEGWNLQEGHTIIFTELDWKAWLVVQAIYRILRPGQKYVPTIVFPVYRDSVSDYMALMIAAKSRAMRAMIIGQNAKPELPRFSELLTRLVWRLRLKDSE